MTSRFSRIGKTIHPNPLFAWGRKPRIIPMSRQEQHIQDELHRRREEARIARENAREPRS